MSHRSSPGTPRWPGKTSPVSYGWSGCRFATRRPGRTLPCFCRTTSRRNATRRGGSAGPLRGLRRLRKAIRESTAIQYLGTEYRLETFLVSVTFPRDGKDLPGLWRVAEAKNHQNKQTPPHRLHLREEPLWNA